MGDCSDSIRVNLAKFIALLHKEFKPSFEKSKKISPSLTKNQVRTIMLLGCEQRLYPSKLGKYLSMEKGSITSLIDSLEDLGLIYKEADENDRRRFWILLTDEGKDFYEKQRNITNSEIERIFENSTDEEINQFNKDLLNLIKILERND